MGEPVIELLAEEWRSLDELCSALPEAAWVLATDCPGWNVQDQLAHVIGTESMLAGRPMPEAPAEVTGAAHVRNPIGAANEAWIHSMRPLPPAEVLARFREISALRLDQLRSAPPERFDELGPTPVGQAPYREFLNVRVMDCWVHEQDIRRAVGHPGHRSGPVVEHSLARFVGAMPFVVGKKAGAPDGGSVVFRLTGEAGRVIAVGVVDGRATALPAPPADPTVTLTMDAEAWWCLALGRTDGPTARASGAVAMAGDTDLGARVVDAMAFMI